MEKENSGPAGRDEVEMVLVPRIPTKEMLDAAWADALAEDAAGVWHSMIENWLSCKERKDG
ncbi:MAG: hypothetical protein KGK16_04290 [Bradyrhizobium sp.]|nr:hypothetical protein [Bradyrhizobium sp.]